MDEKGAGISSEYSQVNPRLRLKIFVFIFVIVLTISILITPRPTFFFVSAYTTIVWSWYLPTVLTGLLGAFKSRKIKLSDCQETISNKVIFQIPTVAREDTIPALHRVVGSILANAPRNLLNFRIDIILDEGSAGIPYLREIYSAVPSTRLVIIPKAFRTSKGTLYKARANEYARLLRREEGENAEGMFIYHLDDDTAIDSSTVASIAEFVTSKSSKYHLAQGILTFPHELSPSFICRLADSARPVDDLTRFYFATEVLGTPIAGLHGEHLLIKASVEDEIGWDFGPVRVEDAYFALKFSERYPGKSTFLNSCTYGASPSNFRDLIKQRKRWCRGLISLVFDRSFDLKTKLYLSYCVGHWSIGIFQHVGVVLLIAYILGMPNTSPLLRVVIPIWAFNLAFIIWIYIEGLRINLSVSHSPTVWESRILEIAIVPLVWLLSAIEGLASALGLLDFLTRRKGFDVISKRR